MDHPSIVAPSPLAAMLAAHPQRSAAPTTALIACIEACLECFVICTSCADACLAEPGVADLRTCIRLDLDCADLCITTVRVAARQTAIQAQTLQQQIEACQGACTRCEEECRLHADHHEHCRLCADACARCAEACRAALDVFVRGG